jgi:hypothetical protein
MRFGSLLRGDSSQALPSGLSPYSGSLCGAFPQAFLIKAHIFPYYSGKMVDCKGFTGKKIYAAGFVPAAYKRDHSLRMFTCCWLMR